MKIIGFEKQRPPYLSIVIACFAILMITAAAAFFLRKTGEKETEWRPGTPLAREDLKVGVIHLADVSDVTSGYSYAHEMGIRKMQREIGLRDDQIIRKNNVSDLSRVAMEQAMRECVVEGARIIFATSWGYMDACLKLADEYPNVIFAHASGFKKNDANFTNYFGRIYEAWYLGGIVAGLRTTTDKTGFVAAMDKGNAEVTTAVNAFAMGVESVNPDARVYVKVTHRWFDPAGEADAARSLIMMNSCDVITHYTDTSSPLSEAEKAGVWGLGYNTDMAFDAPDAVMTSVVWDWGIYYTQLTLSVIDGSFTTEPYHGGLREGIVGLAPFNERLMPPAATEAVATARRRIESGEFGVFEGRIETNDGRVIGEEGRRLSGEELSGVDWYYRNVVE